jgi:hypothetical protein
MDLWTWCMNKTIISNCVWHLQHLNSEVDISFTDAKQVLCRDTLKRERWKLVQTELLSRLLQLAYMSETKGRRRFASPANTQWPWHHVWAPHNQHDLFPGSR